jgi:hypothetical protein
LPCHCRDAVARQSSITRKPAQQLGARDNPRQAEIAPAEPVACVCNGIKNKEVDMSQPASQATIALLFARGDRLFECRLAAADALPKLEDEVELHELDLHTRSHEHCTRPCCAEVLNRKARFAVKSACDMGAGWDGLNAAIEDRDWEEERCTRNEWCRLFDSYSLAGYLGIGPDTWDAMPKRVVLVEVEPVCAGSVSAS